MTTQQIDDWKDTLLYVVAWLASTVLFVIVLVIFRGLVMDLMTWISLSWEALNPQGWHAVSLSYRWIQEFIDRAMLLILGCIAIAAMVAIEYYYRRGAQQGTLVKHIARVVGAELAVGTLGLALSALLALGLAISTSLL